MDDGSQPTTNTPHSLSIARSIIVCSDIHIKRVHSTSTTKITLQSSLIRNGRAAVLTACEPFQLRYRTQQIRALPTRWCLLSVLSQMISCMFRSQILNCSGTRRKASLPGPTRIGSSLVSTIRLLNTLTMGTQISECYEL